MGRQTFALERNVSAGHVLSDPLQVSATSQRPAEGRHVEDDVSLVSAGQVPEEPLQVSTASQTPAAPRQTEPDAAMEQVPLTAAPAATLQAWQSTVEPPHAVSQQTPSAQWPELQSASSVQDAPRLGSIVKERTNTR